MRIRMPKTITPSPTTAVQTSSVETPTAQKIRRVVTKRPGQQSAEQSSGSGKARTCVTLLAEYKKATDPAAFVSAITSKEAALLTDHWGTLIETVAPIDKDISTCAAILKEYALSKKIPEVKAEQFSIESGSSTSTEITATIAEIIEWLKKNKKMHLLDSVLGLKVTDARKLLGDSFMNSISKSVTTPYSTLKKPKRL